MSSSRAEHRLYDRLACWLCLPSFVFLLAPVLRSSGESGDGLALVVVLLSLWVAPMFTVAALGIGLFGHYVSAPRVRETRMWILIALAVTANLLVTTAGVGVRLLR